ncbi:hypothetical protein FOA52_011846 [Chlamydomonas sp. UWO 241]|nr:hypothetical protein FOA52_011846 [Chlamydomonas sp. UWO 241]
MYKDLKSLYLLKERPDCVAHIERVAAAILADAAAHKALCAEDAAEEEEDDGDTVVPDALKSSIPVGELAGILLLLVFGIKAIGEGLKPEQGVADEERQDAEESVKEAETSGKISSGPAATFAQSFVQFGVAARAIAGHAIATGIAVVGGAFASGYISEKTINLVSGVLFIVFAIASAAGLF